MNQLMKLKTKIHYQRKQLRQEDEDDLEIQHFLKTKTLMIFKKINECHINLENKHFPFL